MYKLRGDCMLKKLLRFLGFITEEIDDDFDDTIHREM